LTNRHITERLFIYPKRGEPNGGFMKKLLAVMLFSSIVTASALEAARSAGKFMARRSIQRGLCRSGICRKAGKINRRARVATRAARTAQRSFSAPTASSQSACPNGMCSLRR
jgi:hypothetical protein